MDYEHKYNELVEAVRAVVKGNQSLCKIDEGLGRLNKLLPENESKDEKIRKAICAAICGTVATSILEANGTNLSDALTYLQKQKDEAQKQFNLGVQAGKEEAMYEMEKEQKPAKQNDDEMIRNRIIGYLKLDIEEHPEREERINEMLAYLERQKEYIEDIRQYAYNKGLVDAEEKHKPLSTEETELNSIAFLEQLGYTCVPPGTEQKPAEWSEEDKGMLGKVFECIRFAEDHYQLEEEQMHYVDVKLWLLDHINPQLHWKPSKEQMESLYNAVVRCKACSNTVHLPELYEDLKTL